MCNWEAAIINVLFFFFSFLSGCIRTWHLLIRTCVHRERAHRRPICLLVDKGTGATGSFFFFFNRWIANIQNWLFLFL